MIHFIRIIVQGDIHALYQVLLLPTADQYRHYYMHAAASYVHHVIKYYNYENAVSVNMHS